MPSIPNLPTDNLYKFSFLGGLTLIIVATFLFFTQGESMKEKSNILEIEIAKITDDTVFFNNDLIQLKNEIDDTLESDIGKNKYPNGDYKQRVSNMLTNLNDKNYREYISFISEHENIIFPNNAIIDKLVVKTEQYKEKMKLVTLNIAVIDVKNKQLNREFESFYLLSIVVILLILLGSKIATNGRKGWVKFQNIADEKNAIELEILKKQFAKMESDELNHPVNPT